MKENFNYQSYNHLHFIGVGGISMSGLATHSLMDNKLVSGSDLEENSHFVSLKKSGAEVYIGSSNKYIKRCDAVIYTSAVDDNDKELLLAKRYKKPIFKRSEMLSSIMLNHKNSIAVAGSHGKTTATAMIASVLKEANKYPTAFCGGDTLSFGNYIKGNGEYIVSEVCEYKKNILDVSAKIAVVLNIDNDHMDCYKNIDEVIETFKTFTQKSLTIYNADDKNACKISHNFSLSYGIENRAHYLAEDLSEENGEYSFNVKQYGINAGRIKLKVKGLHNVYNAMAAVAVCDVLKIPFHKIKSALENFSGVKRRNEYIGKINSCKIYADYAHHPKEIQATHKMFSNMLGESFTVFQPHTYSRTKLLMEDFIFQLKKIKNLILYRTYPAREKFNKDGDCRTLYEELIKSGKRDICYCDNIDDLKSEIDRFSEVCSVGIVLGAGDVYQIVKGLL